MKLTGEEQITVDSYDKLAEAWTKVHQSENFWGKEMAKFYEFLPKGKVLELGSGGGRDARELIELGYDYVGTDVSAGLIEQARKLNTKAAFLNQSIYDLDFPPDSFDGFWASAVLLHIPKARIDEALVKINSVVRERGIGFISLKKGTGEKMTEKDATSGDKLRRLFSFYEQKEFREILSSNDFEVIEEQVKPTGEKTTWLIYFVRVLKN